MNLAEIYKPVESELGIVEKRLLELSLLRAQPVGRALAKMLAAGGKRLRPALLLMSAKACNSASGNGHAIIERSMSLAVAVELVHTASLVHDDVIDDAATRRGVRTLNSRWGNRVSILVGDHLFAAVVNVLAEDGDPEVLRSVAATTSRMVQGELAQNLCQSMTKKRYLEVIKGKTASLMSCVCGLGAIAGQGSPTQVQAMREFGLNFGMAFQITDDLLDFTADEKELGKTLGADIRQGKMTLPFIHAASKASAAERKWVKELFGSGDVSRSSLRRARALVDNYGGIAYSRSRATDYVVKCKSALMALATSENAAALSNLADYVLGRGL